LAIIAHKETEALHRIEEFDGAGCFIACQLTLGWSCVGFLNFNHVANNLKILCGNFPAAINQIELEFLTFSETFKPSTLNRADVDEYVLTTGFLLNKAEAFLAVKEFDCAFASADDLSGHTVETAASASATTAAARATAPTTEWAATETAAITIAAAKTVTTASAAEAISATIISEVARGWKTISAAKWIEAILAETVALILAAPTSPIVTHN
jgi:hypothetical protein